MRKKQSAYQLEFKTASDLTRPKIVAIYVRVSTEEQHPENQIMELENFTKERGYSVHHVYVDKISGAKDSRPGLNDLMRDARLKKFNAVIVWKLDRLGRSLQHLLQIIQEFKNLNIGFICSTQPIDTTSATGELIFHIFGAISQFERELIVERIYLGLDRAKKQGKHLGRPKGKKDSHQRKKSGYYNRWIREGKKPSQLKRIKSLQENKI